MFEDTTNRAAILGIETTWRRSLGQTVGQAALVPRQIMSKFQHVVTSCVQLHRLL